MDRIDRVEDTIRRSQMKQDLWSTMDNKPRRIIEDRWARIDRLMLNIQRLQMANNINIAKLKREMVKQREE